MRQPAPSGLLGWLLSKQALFYRELSGLIRAAKSDGTALWGLMGVSFAYGIFHAAGPGHGKAVISSYLVANEETWRRGVTLSFASALLQALTAVVIVGVAAVLDRRDRQGDGRHRARHRDRQLRADRAGRRPAALGEGARVPSHAARAQNRETAAGRAGRRARSRPHHGHAACCHHNHAHHHHEPGAQPSRKHGSRIITSTAHTTATIMTTRRRTAVGPRAWAGAGRTGRPGRLAARALGDRRGRPATVLGRDHRAGLRAGAGAVLGRRRLHLRHGDRHCHHGRGNRHACRRRKSGGEAVRGDARRATAR